MTLSDFISTHIRCDVTELVRGLERMAFPHRAIENPLDVAVTALTAPIEYYESAAREAGWRVIQGCFIFPHGRDSGAHTWKDVCLNHGIKPHLRTPTQFLVVSEGTEPDWEMHDVTCGARSNGWTAGVCNCTQALVEVLFKDDKVRKLFEKDTGIREKINGAENYKIHFSKWGRGYLEGGRKAALVSVRNLCSKPALTEWLTAEGERVGDLAGLKVWARFVPQTSVPGTDKLNAAMFKLQHDPVLHKILERQRASAAR